MRHHQFVCHLAFAATLALGGCGDNFSVGADGGTTCLTTWAQPEGGPFRVRGSVEQVHVWRAAAATPIQLVDPAGAVVAEGMTDALGSFVFRKVAPAEGYRVRVGLDEVSPITVKTIAGSTPEQSCYDGQTLAPGYGYFIARDGTPLAYYVTLPGPPEEGPYPTVVNYSGYSPARPGQPIAGAEGLCRAIPALCDKPDDPSAFFAALAGYATVSVNMRGTGCSGGAYDFFEELQLLDGYDLIETVAAQPWVLGHRVGMVGLSYPGISQLFVAATQPPSLAAITPLSVIGSAHSTMRPGGIFNDGFGLSWISNVLGKAAPYAQGWEQSRVDEGDAICEDNQFLHSQMVDNVGQARATTFYVDIVERVDPTAFVDQIRVPVFLASAYQDEQTGPNFFTLLDKFTSAPSTRFVTYNGVHVDGFAPDVFAEMQAFLDIYVAHRVPTFSSDVNVLVMPEAFKQAFGISGMHVPALPFSDQPTWEAAKAAFEAEPPYRAVFERGASTTAIPGAPVGTFELRYPAWPHPATTVYRRYFHSDGSLGAAPDTTTPGAALAFDLDADAGQRGILAPGGGIWDALPDYAWAQPAAGRAVVLDSAPLPETLVMLGTGSVDLWLRSPVDDADLEVNLSEIRPDGQEMFVQSGWLRASYAGIDAATSTELAPRQTFREADWAPLVAGEWKLVRVPIAAFSHVFRAGSRIRISVDTPGDSRAEWRFDLAEFGEPVTYHVGADATHPSSVALPVLAGVSAPSPLPPCPSLRGQQCRSYVPYTNTLTAP
ncbi:MAG TPA: CocE/NonD family hydrolase [Kofleriaceae bacterium]|nr:CocE/NonD family hydrolase [Kofleriaceae bacterium]